jgi:hypothetical protein
MMAILSVGKFQSESFVDQFTILSTTHLRATLPASATKERLWLRLRIGLIERIRTLSKDSRLARIIDADQSEVVCKY